MAIVKVCCFSFKNLSRALAPNSLKLGRGFKFALMIIIKEKTVAIQILKKILEVQF